MLTGFDGGRHAELEEERYEKGWSEEGEREREREQRNLEPSEYSTLFSGASQSAPFREGELDAPLFNLKDLIKSLKEIQSSCQ